MAYPPIIVTPWLYGTYTEFPMGPENTSATPIYDENLGLRYQLSATQQRYSFNYYEIYAPLTVFMSKNSYITYNGFTASYDPNTVVCLNGDDTGSLRAIYR